MDFQLLNKTVCLCGKRHSGKSELIKYIVSLYRHQFNKIFVICPSEAVNKFYSQFLPSENIFTEYKEEWVDKLMQRLIKINVGKKDNEAAHILLILDDCVSDVNMHSAKNFEKIFAKKEIPDVLPEFKATPADSKLWLPKLLVDIQFAASTSEGKRLVAQGAVRINEAVAKEEHYPVSGNSALVLQCGKRKFAKILLS